MQWIRSDQTADDAPDAEGYNYSLFLRSDRLLIEYLDVKIRESERVDIKKKEDTEH